MEKKFLSIKQVSEFSSLSKRFLYQLCQKREIRFFRIGKRIVINSEDLQDLITRDSVERVDWDEKAREFSR